MPNRGWILRDFVSPTNLWGFVQWAAPVTSAAVIAWLAHAAKEQPHVVIAVSLMCGACAAIIVSEIRKNSIRGKLSLHNIVVLRLIWNQNSSTGTVQLRAIFKNNHPLHHIFFRLETLNQTMQGHSQQSGTITGDVFEVPSLGEHGYVFLGVPVALGPLNGWLHVRLFYGKSADVLNHTMELKISIPGTMLIDANGQAVFDYNWLIEEKLDK
jgi:hypothetical protein